MEFYYHDASPPAQAVMMLMNTLGVKYELKFVDLLNSQQKSEEFLKMNPVGLVPIIKEGDFILCESRPIGIYLCMANEPEGKESKFYPTDLKGMAKINMMLSIETDIYKKVYAYAHIRKMLDGEKLEEDKRQGMYDGLDTLEDFLSRTKYMAADHLTIVDFFALATVKILDLIPFKDWGKYPQILRWKGNMEKVPGFEDGMGKHVKKYSDQILKSYWGL